MLMVREGVTEDNERQVELTSEELEEVEGHEEEQRTEKVDALMEVRVNTEQVEDGGNHAQQGNREEMVAGEAKGRFKTWRRRQQGMLRMAVPAKLRVV